MTESARDFAPIAALGRQFDSASGRRSRASISNVLDQRMKALKDALHDGFGVAPARVLQSSYEPIQYDETGALCGAQPTLGIDVHPGLKLSKARLQETADFLRDFLGRLECIASTSKGKSCPAGLATGAGTGFTLVTDHIPEFTKRGMCARDPKRALRRRHQHAHAAQDARTAMSSSPIRRRRRCPTRITGGCSARRTTRSSRPIPTAKGMSLFDILQPA